MAKRFILNADDFGLSKALNRAVFEGYQAGLLKSASLVANGEAFDEAINSIIPQCPDLGVGIHLNIMEGKSLCEDLTALTDSNGVFNNSYVNLLIKAYNPKEIEFYPQLEREFRRQIEKIMSKTRVTHIDSHVHVHSIPKIFDMVCRLAKEYEIPCEIRSVLYNHLLLKSSVNESHTFELNFSDNESKEEKEQKEEKQLDEIPNEYQELFTRFSLSINQLQFTQTKQCITQFLSTQSTPAPRKLSDFHLSSSAANRSMLLLLF